MLYYHAVRAVAVAATRELCRVRIISPHHTTTAPPAAMTAAPRDAVIYKFLPAQLWRDAVAAGSFAGAAVDLADGFMHFSNQAQAEKTVRLYFAGQKDLVSVAIDVAALQQACAASGKADAKVQWDWVESRGVHFAHLYGMALPVGCATAVEALVDREDGGHDLPVSLLTA
jgi:uncharacterized protein (DUF952 family)